MFLGLGRNRFQKLVPVVQRGHQTATVCNMNSLQRHSLVGYGRASQISRRLLYMTHRDRILSRKFFVRRKSTTSSEKEKKQSILKRFPFASQLIFVTVKTAGTDFFVQTVVEKKAWTDIDVKRNIVFTLFGAIYLGAVQYAIYVEGFKRLFPAMERFCSLGLKAKLKDIEGIKSLFFQIGLDFVLIQPLLYWPAFYMCKEFVLDITESVKETKDSLFQRAMLKYKENIIEDNLGMCGFWFPVDIIIYSVPIHLRLILNHGARYVTLYEFLGSFPK